MAVGGTLLKRQKRFLRLDFLNRGGRSARGVRGNSSPMFGSPRGGAREGVRAAAPRPQGGRATACAPGWGGANIWEPPGGRTGRGASSSPPTAGREGYSLRPWVGRGEYLGAPGGAHGKGCVRQAPIVPKGYRGLPGAPLGGAGENCSRQGYCAPELRGRRGLNSSICVISACANIHRISPHCCPAVD